MPLLPLRILALLLCAASVMRSQQKIETTPSAASGIEGAEFRDVLNLDKDLSHVQGVDLDETRIWVTSVNASTRKGYLTEFDRATGRMTRQLDLTDGARLHPGGFSYSKGSLWIPVAEYKPNSSTVILEIDAATFVVKKRLPVADHLGCLAVNDDTLVAGNWGSQKLYVLDHEGHTIRVIDKPSAVQFQDLKFDGPDLVASGYATAKNGSVTWFRWPDLQPERTLSSGVTDRGRPYTAEGMTIKGHDLYLLPEDSPTRLFHFVIKQP